VNERKKIANSKSSDEDSSSDSSSNEEVAFKNYLKRKENRG
jgi:hypothetical protein